MVRASRRESEGSEQVEVGGTGVADGYQCCDNHRNERDARHHCQVAPWYGERLGSRIKDAMKNFDQHVRECPRGGTAGCEAGSCGREGFCPDECAQLAWVGAERGGDGERASSFVEAEPQGESCGSCGEGEREAELDTCEPVEVDGGEAGSDDLAARRKVGDRRAVPSCCRSLSATAVMLVPPVSTRNAPTVSLPVVLVM